MKVRIRYAPSVPPWIREIIGNEMADRANARVRAWIVPGEDNVKDIYCGDPGGMNKDSMITIEHNNGATMTVARVMLEIEEDDNA